MMKRERQGYILRLVRERGSVTTNELVAEFGLAEDTIRKDFQSLAASGQVRRVHGGVMRIEEGVTAFEERASSQTEEKRTLSSATLPLLEDKHVIYLDGSTTNLALAEQMGKLSCTVITNSPAIALALCRHQGIEVSLIGGQLDHTTQVIMGADAARQVSDMNFECSILGVSHLSPQTGITFPSSSESALKREVIAHSKQVIAIATRNKLGMISAFRVADISAIDILVTNETDEQTLNSYEDAGTKVISVG